MGTEDAKSHFENLRGRLGKGVERGKLSHISENSTSFEINVVVMGDGENMVLNEKLTKIEIAWVKPKSNK